MMNTKYLRIKNLALFALASVYFIISRLFSRPLISDPCDKSGLAPPTRDITEYLRGNVSFLLFFVLFVSFASTSFLLGYLIYNKFDRNRAASLTAVRAGLFFACVAAYIATGTNSLDIFASHIGVFDFISVIALMFGCLCFLAYWSTVCTKKWVMAADVVFSLMVLAVFVLGLTEVNPHIVHWMISGMIMMFLTLLLVCTAIHTRDAFLKKTNTRILHGLLGVAALLLLAAAQVMFAFKQNGYYWIFLALGIGVMGYIVFTELINIAARQYAQSADAENYRKMAYTDALCEISNRNAFVQEQNNTYDSDSLYYVVFDVNNLKHINDVFGHSEGDVIIQNAARLIRDSFKAIGKCYRIGGDEFAVIGQYKTAEEIRACLRQMRSEIDRYNVSSPAKLDIAFGYAIRDNTDINTYELFNKADKAMYRYKRRSKSRILSA